MDNLDTVFDVALPIVVNTVKVEIGGYLGHCYDGLRSVRYKVSYDRQFGAIECLFRWGEFASRYMLSIGDVMDIRLQGMVIEGMMKEVSSGFVKMAVQKQNEVACVPHAQGEL